jgi:DNA-binding CsgD family transcriptional regulator
MTKAETARIEDLVRLAIELNLGRTGAAPQHQGSNLEDIVFDIEFEGSRYLLVRFPKLAQADVQLSPREREIVRLVARGHSNKIIADVLNISSWTVCTHMRRIFAKLGVASRAAMVARMPEMGLTAPVPGTGQESSARGGRTCANPKAESRMPPLLHYSLTDRIR